MTRIIHQSAKTAVILCLLVSSSWFLAIDAVGQDDASAGNSGPDLAARQTAVAARYAKLEELLLRLADVEARENPQRAALLKRVARQSRQKFVLEKLRGAGTSLAEGQFAAAIGQQKDATDELKAILKLLMSEDRSTRIRDEKKRIAELIKQLRLTERNERSVRARTENGVEIEEVQQQQQQVTEKAYKLNADWKSANEPPLSEDSKSEDSESNNAESKPSEPDPSETKSPSPDSNEPKDASQSEKPSQESPSSKASDSSSGNRPPPSPQEQARRQMESAIERMRQAEQSLDKNKRSEATQQQREAEEKLRNAIDQLEKILRQLREEEIERELAKLEARLRRMAKMQSDVLDQTTQLAQTPSSQRTRATLLKAGDLAFEEQKITLEADRAMLVLKGEGSSVAFPEVISQVRDDTRRVATRLGQAKIDGITQGIQSDVLAALEEMIAALQKAQRDREKKKQQAQQGQPQSSGQREEPLVESIAELKLIRTMQKRIQGTTKRYGEILDSDDSADRAEDPGDVLPLLQDLSLRQDRLYRITRDLVTKRNK
ncbi:MAG: hypothetical protein AAF539_07165 [Planctomycetota bacterium]